MQTINLRQLEAFCAVVEKGSFTAAAEALYLAQSTVSGHIAALEQDLGTPLLIRTGKRQIRLTEAGRQVYAHAHTILQSCSELSRELTEQNSLELTVAASSIPMQYILPPLMAAFAAQEPQVRFNLRGGNSESVHAAVLHGDAGVGFVGAVLDMQSFLYDQIAEDPLVLVTPDMPRFRQLKQSGCSGNQLLTEPLLFREGGSGTQLAGQRFLSENGIRPEELRIVARIDDSTALLRAVECGMGCAVVSALAARSREKLLSFPLSGKSSARQLYMIRPRDRRLTRAASRFVSFVLDSDRQGFGFADR